jgi:hypothetical protein
VAAVLAVVHIKREEVFPLSSSLDIRNAGRAATFTLSIRIPPFPFGVTKHLLTRMKTAVWFDSASHRPFGYKRANAESVTRKSNASYR